MSVGVGRGLNCPWMWLVGVPCSLQSQSTAYSPNGNHNVHAKVQVVSSAMGDPLNVLTMCDLQDILVSGIKAVPQSIHCLWRPFPDGTCGCGLSLDLWLIVWCEQDQVMSYQTSPVGAAECPYKLPSHWHTGGLKSCSSWSLVRQFTFPMMIEGTEGLYFHRLAPSLAFTFAPALQPRRLLLSYEVWGWTMPAHRIVWSEISFSRE